MSYTIIYGFNENAIDIIKKTDNVILIEPFTKNIEKITNYRKQFNFELVKKLLISEFKLSKLNVYETIKSVYTLDKPSSVNSFIKTHEVFCCNLESIIKDYDIHEIKNIYINLNISNLKNLFDSWTKFNNLIEKVTLPIMINQELLNNLFFTFYEENISLQENSSLDFHYMHYIHKNLKLKKPKILLYDLNCETPTQLNKLIKRENIVIYSNDSNDSNNSNLFLHEKLLNNLDKIFKREDINEIDIIIQFNSKYYNLNNFFNINYQIQDTILYINKEYEIVYSTKNCMHMLYEILKSKYFEEYINLEKEKRKKLFKIFYKRTFYEYIQKIFKIVYI